MPDGPYPNNTPAMMNVPIRGIIVRAARSWNPDLGETMSTNVINPMKMKPMVTNPQGLDSIDENDARPLLPVTAAMVEMLGDSAKVTNQFAEIARKGMPVKTKPSTSAPPKIGPMFLLIQT